MASSSTGTSVRRFTTRAATPSRRNNAPACATCGARNPATRTPTSRPSCRTSARPSANGVCSREEGRVVEPDVARGGTRDDLRQGLAQLRLVGGTEHVHPRDGPHHCDIIYGLVGRSVGL